MPSTPATFFLRKSRKNRPKVREHPTENRISFLEVEFPVDSIYKSKWVTCALTSIIKRCRNSISMLKSVISSVSSRLHKSHKA